MMKEWKETTQALLYILEHANRLADDPAEAIRIKIACESLRSAANEIKRQRPFCAICQGIENIRCSAEAIDRLGKAGSPARLSKIYMELIPLIQETIFDLSFFLYAFGDEKKEQEFYETDYKDLTASNVSQTVDLSIIVLAYNHVDKTRLCVESILDNLPSNHTYEIILCNNGSTDETGAYFDSLHLLKTMTLKVNCLSNARAVSRIAAGEYILSVNNDVIVTPGAIDNLMACMASDSRLGMVVPTTPNISNNQATDLSYMSYRHVQAYGALHNAGHEDMEDRARLCNPIALMRASAIHEVGEHDPCFPFGQFSDDALSYRLRQAGYRLAIDWGTFCYHFGSVTMRDDEDLDRHMAISRALFFHRYKFDAWGCCSR